MNGKYKKLFLLSLISLNFSAFGMFDVEKGTDDNYDWLKEAELAATKTPADGDLSFFTFNPSRISPEALGASLIQEVKYGHIHNVRQLIALGADIRVVNETGNTALLAAALNNNKKIVDLLLEKAKERKQHVLTRDILDKITGNTNAQEIYNYLEEIYYERNET